MGWLLAFEAEAGSALTLDSAVCSGVALTREITIRPRAPFRRFELLDERLEKELMVSRVSLFGQDLLEDSRWNHKLALLIGTVCLDATSPFFQFCLAIVLEADSAETMTTVSHCYDLICGTLVIAAWAFECRVTLLAFLCEAEFEAASHLKIRDLSGLIKCTCQFGLFSNRFYIPVLFDQEGIRQVF